MNKTRVLFVIHDLGEGGAQRQLLLLLRGLDRTRVAPVVLALRHGGAWAGRFRAAGARVLELRRTGSLSLRRLVQLASVLRRLRPQVVHTINAPGNIYGRLALWLGRPASRPVVVASERGHELDAGGFRAWLDRRCWRAADAVLCNSRALANQVARACPSANVAVVGNGIAVRPPAPSRIRQTPEPVVAAVGRMVPEKDFATLLRAAATLRDRGVPYRLRMVGDGPARAELEQQAARLSLGACVSFAGRNDDVAGELERADILAMSSVTESSPNVVLEAMERSLPVVATDVGDVRDIVEDGVTGLLVPAGRDQDLAQALERLLRCPATRARLGAAGRTRVLTRHPIAATVAATVALWRECGAVVAPSVRVAFLPIFVHVVHWFAQLDRALRRRGADAVHLSLFTEDWNQYRREGIAAVPRSRLARRLPGDETRLARQTGTWRGILLDELLRYDLLRYGARGPRLLPRLRVRAARYLAGIDALFARTRPTHLVVTGDSWTAVRCAVAMARRRGIVVTFFEQGPYGTTVWDQEGALAHVSFARRTAPEPVPGLDQDPRTVFVPRAVRRWASPGSWSSRLARAWDAVLVRVPLHLWPLAPVELASAEPLRPPRGRLRPQRLALPPAQPYVLLALQVPNDVQVVLHSPLLDSLEELVRATLHALPAGHRLLVKEHPNQAGRYPRAVYAALAADPRACLVDGLSLDALIDGAAAVVVLNSTVGLDALRRGRTVVTLGNAFYTASGLVHRVERLSEFGAVLACAVRTPADLPRIAAYLRMLRDQHLVPGHFTDDPAGNVELVVDRLLHAAEPELPVVAIPALAPAGERAGALR